VKGARKDESISFDNFFKVNEEMFAGKHHPDYFYNQTEILHKYAQ
jgi:hypothetical protein